MRIKLLSTAAIMLLSSVSLGSQQAPPKSSPPSAPKPQPIPFSHKQHSKFVAECGFCHEMPEPGEDMTFPEAEKCMTCHSTIATGSPAIMKLVEYAKNHQPVPWVQIYSLPDFVYFSHKTHLTKGKVACEECHGPVAERDVITKEKDISMKACVGCHTQMHARVTCNTCHNPQP